MIRQLKEYFNRFEKEAIPQVSVNCVIMGFHENSLQVIVNRVSLGNKELVLLPGGYIFQHEDLQDTVKRIVKESTGLENILFKQFAVFGNANRSFGEEFASAFNPSDFKTSGLNTSDLNTSDFKTSGLNTSDFKTSGLNTSDLNTSDLNTSEYKPSDLSTEGPASELDLSWFSRRFLSICYLALVDYQKIRLNPTQFYDKAEWLPIRKAQDLSIDHSDIVQSARETLLKELPYTPIESNLLPPQFTLPELQKLFEAILGRDINRPNFRRKMLSSDLLIKEGKDWSGKGRPADLYRFRHGKETNFTRAFKFGF